MYVIMLEPSVDFEAIIFEDNKLQINKFGSDSVVKIHQMQSNGLVWRQKNTLMEYYVKYYVVDGVSRQRLYLTSISR